MMYHFHQLCDKHPDILTTNVWVTIGFTYHATCRRYCLIKVDDGLCLACTNLLLPEINAFCFNCKAPRPVDWTNGNESLDSFIMESRKNTSNMGDAYIQWIEYSLLTNVRQITSSHHSCTHMAEWLEPNADELTRVTLKKIVDEQNDHFYQVNYFICKQCNR